MDGVSLPPVPNGWLLLSARKTGKLKLNQINGKKVTIRGKRSICGWCKCGRCSGQSKNKLDNLIEAEASLQGGSTGVRAGRPASGSIMQPRENGLHGEALRAFLDRPMEKQEGEYTFLLPHICPTYSLTGP